MRRSIRSLCLLVARRRIWMCCSCMAAHRISFSLNPPQLQAITSPHLDFLELEANPFVRVKSRVGGVGCARDVDSSLFRDSSLGCSDSFRRGLGEIVVTSCGNDSDGELEGASVSFGTAVRVRARLTRILARLEDFFAPAASVEAYRLEAYRIGCQ